jgi:hypothetical protein
MIGERRAVKSFLRAEAMVDGQFEVEARESPPTTDPRSGRLLPVPPLMILWVKERPLAVRVRNVIAISRFPPSPRLATLLEGESLAGGLAIERLAEAGLWRLFSRPPRPRLAREQDL